MRVETGVVNRAIYEIAMLHDPVDLTRTLGLQTPDGMGNWFIPTVAVVAVAGSSRGLQQVVSSQRTAERGYALVSSTLNVFGQNCNDLRPRRPIMVKSASIEHFGEPLYTIATGVSGGSYQSHRRQTIIRAYLMALLWD